MFDEKSALRALCKERRDKLKSAAADKLLAGSFFGSPLVRFRSFFLYLSVGTEAGTELILEGLLAADKPVCAPRVTGGEMRSVPYAEPLSAGKFGISEPPCGEETECEVALAPLLAADGEGNRLGYGGGYYDRYFLAHPAVLRVGLCYEGQLLPRVPHGEGDVPLDAVLTEKGLHVFRDRFSGKIFF